MEWISVNDRLPDYSIDVLVTDGNKIQVGNRFMVGESEFFLPDCRDDFYKITHWMQLPNVPGILNPKDYIVYSPRRSNQPFIPKSRDG